MAFSKFNCSQTANNQVELAYCPPAASRRPGPLRKSARRSRIGDAKCCANASDGEQMTQKPGKYTIYSYKIAGSGRSLLCESRKNFDLWTRRGHLLPYSMRTVHVRITRTGSDGFLLCWDEGAADRCQHRQA